MRCARSFARRGRNESPDLRGDAAASGRLPRRRAVDQRTDRRQLAPRVVRRLRRITRRPPAAARRAPPGDARSVGAVGGKRPESAGHGHQPHQGRRAPLVRCLAADRKSTRLNSSHTVISYAVFCLKKKKIIKKFIIIKKIKKKKKLKSKIKIVK